jgi:hypothetical protein
MSAIDSLLVPIKIPKMARVAQNFPRPAIEDVAETVTGKLKSSGVLQAVRPGLRIAITAGSRGISNMPVILKSIVDAVRLAGGDPFVFPAMGSHGGATAEGQLHMLEGMGITDESIGAPIRSSMETVVVDNAPNGRPIYMDKYASEADAVIVVNRIKPHVAFRGAVESGLMKMIAIGMGKQKGADSAHRAGFGQMAENVLAYARGVLSKKNVLCAIGLIENAYHETAEIEVLRACEIESREPKMLERAWELYPKLFFDKLDVLVLDEIGKNISGTGFDTNVLGRYHTRYASGGPDITRIAVLDITDKSGGNGNGLGILDFTTRRAFEKFDFEQSYPNSLTTTIPMSVKIPMVLKNDRQAIQAAIKTCNAQDLSAINLVRIKNTIALDEIDISENLIPYALGHPNLSLAGDLGEMPFDVDGNLF